MVNNLTGISIIVLVIAVLPAVARRPTRGLSVVLICLYVAFLAMKETILGVAPVPVSYRAATKS